MTIRSVIPFTLLAVAVFAAGCGRDSAPPSQDQPEYRPVATVRELMLGMLEPSADAIWESVKITYTASGMEERAPRTDEEWATLRGDALRLMEASNLLQIPGRAMARSDEQSAFPGIELGPAEIQQLVDKDRAGWNSRAQALRELLKPALAAIEAKDAEKLSAAGEEIDTACENCHVQYWYPNAPEPPDIVPPSPASSQP